MYSEREDFRKKFIKKHIDIGLLVFRVKGIS
jgi:hypothetical protein